jgi:coenzyme F420 hydrogenase subunit beta
MSSLYIQKIVDKNLCLGCGLCESICGKTNVVMQMQKNGFLFPIVKNHHPENAKIISRICPGVNIKNNQLFDKEERIWGRVLESYSAWSTDDVIRTKGSSGGIISAVAIYLLENKMVDAVLQIGGDINDFRKNRLKVSKTKEDVLACATSRYAPATVFNDIVDILNDSSDCYCFIGKPCDISGLKNFLSEYPQYGERFILFISIICAGMPSYNATQDAIDSFKTVQIPVTELVYRGNGWPGYFSFTDVAGEKYQMTYNDSWGKILGRKIHFRCKICPDGIGLQADLTVGDAWETKDGYPIFTEREGQSLVLLRTSKSVELFRSMQSNNRIASQNLLIEKIENIQPYQYSRRQIVGARIIATILGKRVFLNFRNMKLWRNLFKSSVKKSIKEFGGTMKRIIINKA